MLQCSAGSGLPAVVAACCVTVVQQGLITGSGEGREGEGCLVRHYLLPSTSPLATSADSGQGIQFM